MARALQRACCSRSEERWEILRSLGLVPDFITDHCCCSQTSGFDVKSQTLQASEPEHLGPVILAVTGELCVSSRSTGCARGRAKGVRYFSCPPLQSVQTSPAGTGLPFACLTKVVLLSLAACSPHRSWPPLWTHTVAGDHEDGNLLLVSWETSIFRYHPQSSIHQSACPRCLPFEGLAVQGTLTFLGLGILLEGLNKSLGKAYDKYVIDHLCMSAESVGLFLVGVYAKMILSLAI